jgi:DNA-binding response OmpR family regulator
MRVLLVEDDSKIAALISEGFTREGFAVDHVSTAEEGLELGHERTYDAAIIDIMLPGMDGWTLIRHLRGSGVNTPVLILSAKRSVDDRVKGLRTGGDDYLTKPFAFPELLARVDALIRRSTGASQPVMLTLKDLTLHLLTREVRRGEQEIDLQPREYALLECLMRNAGRVVSKTMILQDVWGYQFDPQTNTVDVLVSRLRHKIDKDFTMKLIHTIRGVGYVLKTTH